jgi:hypothetical protein
MTNVHRRFSLKGIIQGLMLSDNLDDVHDEINYLHDLVGLPRPEGSFLEGWTEKDMQNVEANND